MGNEPFYPQPAVSRHGATFATLPSFASPVLVLTALSTSYNQDGTILCMNLILTWEKIFSHICCGLDRDPSGDVDFFFFFKRKGLLFKNFIYLFVFVCPGSSLLCVDFSACGQWGLLTSCGMWASHCSAFSCWGAYSPHPTRKALLGVGFSNFGLWALQRRFSS